MKRFHAHADVEHLPAGIAFHTTLAADAPACADDGNAKWMLNDPRIDIAASTRERRLEVGHLGIQTASDQASTALKTRAVAAASALPHVGEAGGCHARSDNWLTDLQGIAREQFHSLANKAVFSERTSTPRPSFTTHGAGEAPRRHVAGPQATGACAPCGC